MDRVSEELLLLRGVADAAEAGWAFISGHAEKSDALWDALDKLKQWRAAPPQPPAEGQGEGEQIPRGEGWRITAPWRIGFGPHDGDALGAAVEKAIRAAESRVLAECEAEYQRCVAAIGAAQAECARLRDELEQAKAATRGIDIGRLAEERNEWRQRAENIEKHRNALRDEVAILKAAPPASAQREMGEPENEMINRRVALAVALNAWSSGWESPYSVAQALDIFLDAYLAARGAGLGQG